MSNPLSGCCGSQSTKQVCGDFPEPENPDLGRCAPYREKRTCEAPALPIPECDDTEAYVEYTPDLPFKFRVVSRIFDENCLPILDENNAPILGVSV